MNVLDQHNKEIDRLKYTGVVTQFDGYIQFGDVKDSAHNTIGYTADQFKRFISYVTAPNYAYSRQKSDYINIYVTDSNSPTGVSLIGGIPNELEFLLAAFEKTGQLSPTEDLRTAH